LDVKIAVVGCGTWGKNLVRNFYNLGVLHTVCDLDKEVLLPLSVQYPGINITDNIDNLIASNEIDALVVATPSHTHYNIVSKALKAGKHVYVEKPIATSEKEAKELNELAGVLEKVLMVGHLLLYHPAVTRLKSLISEGHLGHISYVQSYRQNINYFKNDRNVIWDLAPHDLSMISYVLGKSPLEVISAVGVSTDKDGIIDVAQIDISFEDGIQAHISSSWVHPVKHVILLVKGSKSTAVLNDAEPENKLQVFDNSAPNKKDVEYPEYLEIEPLKLECQHFIGCIINGIKPRSDGDNGYEVVKILEEAEKLMLGNQYNKVSSFKLASSRKMVKPQNNLNESLT